MPPHNFMGADFLAILEGFCIFSLIAFLPGYAIGWLTNVFRFQHRTLPFQLACSAPLAIAVGPVLSYSTGRWFSLNAAWVVYLALAAFAAYRIAWVARNSGGGLFTRFRLFFGLILAWVCIAVCSLADMQVGRRLYFSIIGFDYAIRTGFTQSIATFGIPARNPFYFPGSAAALRYHYFWLIQCGLVTHAARAFVDARQALISGTLWCGIGLICLIPLYIRVFSGRVGSTLRRQSLIGILLLSITGLDVFPALFMVRLNALGLIDGVAPSVEWWNEQVDGWLYTMLWEPHYLCAVVACFMGFLVLWDVEEKASWARSLASAAVAGAAFASATGSGIYVAFVFAVFLSIWTVVALLKKWYRQAAMLLISGVIAAALVLPYLHTLDSSAGVSAGRLFQLTLRPFQPVQLLLQLLRLNLAWEVAAANALTLPLNYFVELGFFFAAGVIFWFGFRKQRGVVNRNILAGSLLIATSVTICTFLKSGVIANNDLGWRGFLIAQFVLLLWGAEVLSAFQTFSRMRQRVLVCLLVIGAAGVVYDLAILRFFPVLSDTGHVPKIQWLGMDEQIGLRTYANREAYEWLRNWTSPQAVIQQNPAISLQDTFFGLYGQRQTAAGDAKCSTFFGGDYSRCPPILGLLERLYCAKPQETLETACRALSVNVFIAKDTDPAWKNKESWIWKINPIFKNGFVRAFECPAFQVIQ